MKKIIGIALFVIIGFGILPSHGSAQTVGELQAMINSLLQQVQQLQAQLAATQQTSNQWCYTFNSNIKFGDRGKEVSNLHRALFKEGFSVPDNEQSQKDGEGDSGHIFGDFTASTVVSFQEKYKSEILDPSGLSHGTGYVGSATRSKLNKLYGCGIILNPISQPSVTLLSPNGGEIFKQGQLITVNWITTGINSDAVGGISLSQLPSGNTKTVSYPIKNTGIASFTADAFGGYGNSYKIGVTFSVDGKQIFDVSDQNISILSPDTTSFSCGDVNQDGVITQADATAINDYIFNNKIPSNLKNVDVNGDGSIDISDAVYLVQYVNAGGPAPKCISNLTLDDFIVLNKPVTGETMYDDFVPVDFSILLSAQKSQNRYVGGQFFVEFKNTTTQKTHLLSLPVSPKLNIQFGESGQYKLDTKYTFNKILYVPSKISDGYYDVKVQLGSPGMSGFDVIVESTPVRVHISRNIIAGRVSVQQTYPKEGEKPVFDATIVQSVPLLKFRVSALSSNVRLRAFEMGTEKGGRIPGADVAELAIFDTANGSKVSDLIDIGANADSVAGYSIYFLKDQITLNTGKSMELELRLMTPKLYLGTEGFYRDVIGFNFVGIYGIDAQQKKVAQLLSFSPQIYLNPTKIIQVNITSPQENALITSDVLDGRFTMFLPASYFKTGETPAVNLTLCAAQNDPILGYKPCLFNAFGEAESYAVAKPLIMDKETEMRFSLRLSEGPRGDLFNNTKAIPNGTYTLTASPAVLHITEYGERAFGATPFKDSLTVRIQR